MVFFWCTGARGWCSLVFHGGFFPFPSGNVEKGAARDSISGPWRYLDCLLLGPRMFARGPWVITRDGYFFPTCEIATICPILNDPQVCHADLTVLQRSSWRDAYAFRPSHSAVRANTINCGLHTWLVLFRSFFYSCCSHPTRSPSPSTSP